MNGTKQMPRSCGNSDQGGGLETNNNYITSGKYLTSEECERLYRCQPGEMVSDMLVREPETLVIPYWEGR